jgi:uncharacterized protein YjbI with pentapeptide repeats
VCIKESRHARRNLTGVHLIDADLSGADLSDANLSRATMIGANLRNANLTGAEGVTQSQLDDACGDTNTKLPSGLTIKPCSEDIRGKAQ